jgi:siroheme synthase (precorrin-2 oxidase/ferrochelatase)
MLHHILPKFPRGPDDAGFHHPHFGFNHRVLHKPISKHFLYIVEQNNSGESKIRGIRKYGKDIFIIETFSIDESLPPILDNTSEYLPKDIQADLVLDFLKHPDLSHDLAAACAKRKIPVVASGKKLKGQRVFVPQT